MKNTQNLMKHFASVLRKKSLGKDKNLGVDPGLLKYLSRKDLIAIIGRKFGKDRPNNLNLVDLENQELLELIEDEMYIISFFVDQWCKEAPDLSDKEPAVSVKKVASKPSSKS
ncbi:MAG: hypothetical protein JJ975_12730 [Bacteroidia bacterium]|nr:hypothetical protein [Bacteroidia bacterium]